MISFCFILGLYLWVLTYAEGQKVIIDAATKKIIIQSWDQNLDLAALKASSENASGSVSEISTGSVAETVSTGDNELTTEETTETSSNEEENSTLYAELEWGEEIDKALYWMYNNGLTKYDNLVDYRPDDPLLREEAAKIIGQAYIILWYPKDVKNTSCTFSDADTFDPTLSGYIKDTCTYWIFRWSNGSFLAQKSLSKAEALTVLIRILEWGLSSEDFNPWWTLYFVKAKNIALSNESDVNSLDRPVTRREIALLMYRFKKIVLDTNLNNAAKQQLSLINQNPVSFVPEQSNKQSSSEDTQVTSTWTVTQTEQKDYSWVLSWVDFWTTTSLSILNSPEVVEAINWMKDNGLTTAKDINSYMPFNYLTREQAAKMFLQFAKALDYTTPLEENPSCEFSDLKEADPNLVDSIKEVCQLWIMLWGNWKFSPNAVMTKSQFVAMLIRIYEWKRLDETTNPWWANYFIKAGELWILDKWDISSFEGSLTRYEAALLFYRFQLKHTINSWLNTWSLKNEVLSSVKNSDGEIASWDIDNSYAVLLDANLLKNQFFQDGYLELLWVRYLLKKTAMTVFDIWDESFVWYGDLYDFASDAKVWTVNFIASNGNIIQWTIRLTDLAQTWIIKESKSTTAWYNLVQL